MNNESEITNVVVTESLRSEVTGASPSGGMSVSEYNKIPLVRESYFWDLNV